MHRTRPSAVCAALACAFLSPPALAEPVTLTVDPARSSITITISALGASDTETSAVTGTVDVCLNDPPAPTIISMRDLDAALSSTLNFVLNYGLLGRITATVSNAAAAYAAGAPPAGPVPVGAAGMFTFADPHTVPVTLTGMMRVVGTGIVGAPVGTQNIDLATFGVFPSQFAATLSNNGSTLTISGAVTFSGTNSDLGVTVTSSGTLTVVATAPLPAGGCPCDFDCTPGVNVFDLLAYLDLWFVGDPAAELTGDAPAMIDVFDLLAFLDCWFSASAAAC